jgi:hypothetical protein
MKEYNEVMRISVENGEEKWGFTPRQDEGEIEKLHQQNAELLKALTDLWAVSHWADNHYEMDAAKLAIAKATEGDE